MDHIEYEPSTQIRHVVYALDDVKSENISQHFNPVYELIERELEKGSVLVHCAAGVSRVRLILSSQPL
jgi:protein-tyrosine phosphatase